MRPLKIENRRKVVYLQLVESVIQSDQPKQHHIINPIIFFRVRKLVLAFSTLVEAGRCLRPWSCWVVSGGLYMTPEQQQISFYGRYECDDFVVPLARLGNVVSMAFLRQLPCIASESLHITKPVAEKRVAFFILTDNELTVSEFVARMAPASFEACV